MRILNICAYTWEIGGPARIIYDHTTEALKMGHEVDILSPMTPGDDIYEIPTGARVIPCRRSTPVSNFYREFSVDLYKHLKNHVHEYDLIHIHGIWHFGSLAPFLIKNKVPKVITIHGLLDKWAVNHHKWKKDLVSFLYQKKILAKADLIQINNADEEENVIEYLGYRPKNLVTIPNGIRMEEYRNLPVRGSFRQQFDIPDDKKLVLFMGRINIKKGLDLLLPAFAAYLKVNNDAILLLAGPEDGYLAETKKFIADHQLTDRIRYVGMLTDTTKLAALADADLFVLPSYSEGFSIAVLEALAAGVPALVSDRVGFGEYIRQYNAAYLSPLSVEGVEKGLSDMLEKASTRAEFAQRGREMVAENFDITRVAQKMLEAYNTVLPT
ncbi:glycosyltransferase [Persicitalea jodogahamensis]|uniref:Glycosyl transferase n=1 Tax=Persicitalea jodogahamensis TaxID=402147 RepID=A0A8J3GAL8_9BACT|nr:glycosyltransferase [Persicitalea jodogahamensis]GHB75747.1 glycosyl transferase [Persicitalea jodogahamensis]